MGYWGGLEGNQGECGCECECECSIGNSIGNTINKIYVKIMEELCIIKTLYLPPGHQISAKRILPATQPDAVQQNVGPRIGFAVLSNLSGDPVHLHPSCKWKVSTCMTDAGVQGHH